MSALQNTVWDMYSYLKLLGIVTCKLDELKRRTDSVRSGVFVGRPATECFAGFDENIQSVSLGPPQDGHSQWGTDHQATTSLGR